MLSRRAFCYYRQGARHVSTGAEAAMPVSENTCYLHRRRFSVMKISRSRRFRIIDAIPFRKFDIIIFRRTNVNISGRRGDIRLLVRFFITDHSFCAISDYI